MKSIFLIGKLGNYALNLIIWARNLVNVTPQLESRETCDNLVDTSIKTKK